MTPPRPRIGAAGPILPLSERVRCFLTEPPSSSLIRKLAGCFPGEDCGVLASWLTASCPSAAARPPVDTAPGLRLPPRRRSDATPCANAAPGACPSRATRSRSFCWTRAGSRGGLPRVHARAMPHVAGPARKAPATPSASLLAEFPDRLQHRAGSPRTASMASLFAQLLETFRHQRTTCMSPLGEVMCVASCLAPIPNLLPPNYPP